MKYHFYCMILQSKFHLGLKVHARLSEILINFYDFSLLNFTKASIDYEPHHSLWFIGNHITHYGTILYGPYNIEPYYMELYDKEPYQLLPYIMEPYHMVHKNYVVIWYNIEPYHLELYHMEPYHIEHMVFVRNHVRFGPSPISTV